MAKVSKAAASTTPIEETQTVAPESKKSKVSKAAAEVEDDASEYFEEWECKISSVTIEGKTTNHFEKLKVARKVVKISEAEADILNEGVLNGKNNYGKMYFRPE